MILVLLIAATVAGLVLGQGGPALAVLPVLALGAALLVARLPPRTLAFGLVALVLCLESPQDRPADGVWHSPLYPLGQVLYAPLKHSVGVPLPFSAFELLVLLMALALILRRQDGVAPPGWRAARGVRGVALVSFVALLAWVGLGQLTGGDFDAAFWQVRELALLAPFAFLFHETLTGDRRELVGLGRLVVGAAVFKTAEGAYFYYAVGVPRGLRFEYVTIHADSLLFVGALLLLILWALHRPSWRSLLGLAVLGSAILWGLLLNDRRVAWAELLGGLALAVVAMPRGPVKRRALKVAVILVPLFAGYAAVGWGSSSRVFAPLQALGSMDEDQDSSTFAREVENYNVARTVEAAPLIGQGFGHPYREVVVNRIGHSFNLYKYIPHNSIYALFMSAGALGFLLIWFPIPLSALLAMRASRASPDPVVRTGMLLCAVEVLVFGFQAWGDMGTQSYLPVMLMGLVLGLSSRTALRTGAWPAALPSRGGAKAIREVEAGC